MIKHLGNAGHVVVSSGQWLDTQGWWWQNLQQYNGVSSCGGTGIRITSKMVGM